MSCSVLDPPPAWDPHAGELLAVPRFCRACVKTSLGSNRAIYFGTWEAQRIHALNYSCFAGLSPQTNAAACLLEMFVVYLNLLFLVSRKTESEVNISKCHSPCFALHILHFFRQPFCANALKAPSQPASCIGVLEQSNSVPRCSYKPPS